MVDSRFVHYKTGIDRIDVPHLSILSKLETIDQLIKDADYSSVLPLIKEINIILDDELMSENQEMVELDFPFRKFHIESHLMILDTFKQLYKEVDSIQSFPSGGRYKFKDYAEIFYDHIDKFDIFFAEWLKKTNKI